jgi:hypothetical protein
MAVIPAAPPGTVPREKKAFEPIPAQDQYKTPTILPVEVLECKLQPINADFREKYDIEATHEFNFRFKVLEGDFKNRNVWANAHALWHDGANCRLRLWAQAIMGVDAFPEGYVFDSDHLVGQTCRITIKNYNKKDGSVGETAADVLPSIPGIGQTTPESIMAAATGSGITAGPPAEPAQQWMQGTNPMPTERSDDEEPF